MCERKNVRVLLYTWQTKKGIIKGLLCCATKGCHLECLSKNITLPTSSSLTAHCLTINSTSLWPPSSSRYWWWAMAVMHWANMCRTCRVMKINDTGFFIRFSFSPLDNILKQRNQHIISGKKSVDKNKIRQYKINLLCSNKEYFGVIPGCGLPCLLGSAWSIKTSSQAVH